MKPRVAKSGNIMHFWGVLRLFLQDLMHLDAKRTEAWDKPEKISKNVLTFPKTCGIMAKLSAQKDSTLVLEN